MFSEVDAIKDRFERGPVEVQDVIYRLQLYSVNSERITSIMCVTCDSVQEVNFIINVKKFLAISRASILIVTGGEELFLCRYGRS